MQALAQTHVEVRDAADNSTVEGALLVSGSASVATSDRGRATIGLQLPAEVTVSHINYQPARIVVKREGQVVYLQPATRLLEEVEVTGFDFRRELIDQPAPVNFLQPEDLAKFNETSLVPSLNTLPGIRMEERAPSSYRLSIRGSSIRSPFGVRNVKVYWNNLPFTEANGTTPLNILDLSNTDRVEILKGPSGSIYGAGTGGVMLLQSAQPRDIQSNSLSLQSMAGSYGLWKHQASAAIRTSHSVVEVRGVYLTSDGYREHSFTDRKVAQLSAHFFPTANNTLSVHSFFSDLNYGIPGGLTLEQLEEDRTQARPGSAERNASIDQKSVYVGLVNEASFSPTFENTTSLLYSYVDFENPFNTDYKREFNSGLGGRTRFVWHQDLGTAVLHTSFGGEWQQGWSNAYNFGNVMGNADTLRFHDDLLINQYFGFVQADLDLPGEWVVTAGLSRNYQKFDINRLESRLGPAFQFVRTFEPVWVPRLAVLKKLGENQSVYASVSQGFSPPTIDEVRTNEGSVNVDLEAEKGTNIEAGYRVSLWQNKWFFDATAFYFGLKETIVTRTNEDGVVLFANAGATNQKGLEVKMNGNLWKSEAAVLTNSAIQLSYTGYHFRFVDYQKGENDFSGNKLTGVAPNTIAAILDLEFQKGFYAHLTWLWSDEIPLTDDNLVVEDSFHNAGVRFGWRKEIRAGLRLEMFAGVDNLLNQEFSLGNDLNAFGGRFYQPAAGRNYYGGIRFNLGR